MANRKKTAVEQPQVSEAPKLDSPEALKAREKELAELQETLVRASEDVIRQKEQEFEAAKKSLLEAREEATNPIAKELEEIRQTLYDQRIKLIRRLIDVGLIDFLAPSHKNSSCQEHRPWNNKEECLRCFLKDSAIYDLDGFTEIRVHIDNFHSGLGSKGG